MRFKSEEIEQSTRDLDDPQATDRYNAWQFAKAWAELLEAGFELDPMQSFEKYLDDNFMPGLIAVGNQPQFINLAPAQYQMASQMITEAWVHGDAFGAWITKLEADTPWDLIVIGVHVAGEEATDGDQEVFNAGGERVSDADEN